MDGDNLGLLVGPKGATVEALQELTRTVVQRHTEEHTSRIVVDVGGYRERRTAALRQFRVLADSTKIHEMLLNLATNAVHAMDGKGTLTLRLFGKNLDQVHYGQIGALAQGEYTVIEVADNGCGMDAATLSRAFEPFFTTKPVGEGTGMGLSVVLGIVQSVGGDIIVESTVGKGTWFTMYLPVAEESVCEVGHDDSRSRITGTERIIFVDDEQMLVDLAEEMLTSLGYQANCFTNSLSAFEFMRNAKNNIDLLITDQTMPGMTGIELTKEVMKIKKRTPHHPLHRIQ